MFATKQVPGYLLIEVMIILTIVSILLPKILGIIQISLEEGYLIIKDNQERIEKMDIYSQVLVDTSHDLIFLSDCCFKTAEHEICYNIKENKFRRRKRGLGRLRFYTHYIGKKKQFDSLICKHKKNILNIKLESKSGKKMDWLFYTDHL